MATLKETAKYFGISFQALAEYVKKYLDEINVDGQHAFIRKGKWHFDEVAIQRLTELRTEKEEFVLSDLESQQPVKKADKKNSQTQEMQKLNLEVTGVKEQQQELVEKLQSLDLALADKADKNNLPIQELQKLTSEVAELKNQQNELSEKIQKIERAWKNFNAKADDEKSSSFMWAVIVVVSGAVSAIVTFALNYFKSM